MRMGVQHMIKHSNAHHIELNVNITYTHDGFCIQQRDALTHTICKQRFARGVVDISHTYMPCNAMLCCVLYFVVLRTHINAQHHSPHAQSTETTKKKKRKHINHLDAERRRCAF